MDRLPLIVSGMSMADRYEFILWLEECCGVMYASCSTNELRNAAMRWYEEQEAASEM